MKKLLTAAAAAAFALTGTAVSAETVAERGEARLAEMLEGRVAGDPQSCISLYRSDRLEVVENVGLVYDAGETIYVARAADPNMLDRGDMPVIERFGSQLCKTDVMRTVDRYSGFTTGVLFIEDFVPFTQVRG